MATNLKHLNLSRVNQNKGLIHTGHRQTTDDRDLGFVGEYFDSSLGKTVYTGLVRSTEQSDNRFVLFDKLESNPFVDETIDFSNVQRSTLEIENLVTLGDLSFNSVKSIDPSASNIINPNGSFEISAVTIADIVVTVNQHPSDYFQYLLDNPDVSNGDYILVKEQINNKENGIYIVNTNQLGGVYLERFNDEATATRNNAPLSVVINILDDTRLVRYQKSLVETIYYKTKTYNTGTNELHIEFTEYDGSAVTTYQSGDWNLSGDTTLDGNTVITKSLVVSQNITVGQIFYESIMKLTSTLVLNSFRLDLMLACIYRCDATVDSMTITLPDVAQYAGRNVKIIKINSTNTVQIKPMMNQSIHGVSNDTIVLHSAYDHVKLTCDGFSWYNF